jgi:hypothetical protein
MVFALTSSALGFAGAAPTRSLPRNALAARMETPQDLEVLAGKLNPILGFYDPLNLAEADFWGKGNVATVGWLRHAEIKHGRVAMFAFVGYCVQSVGLHWPWKLTDSIDCATISAAGSPFEQWDALPTLAKLQIIGAIGVFEALGESSDALAASGTLHYTKGGMPGKYPSLKTAGVPHPVPFDLYDPFGLSKNAEPEKKAKGLLVEINNGRLAMIGIMGFAAAAKVPGSVPALNFIPPYAGEPMGPFVASDSALPFVTDMLGYFQQ